MPSPYLANSQLDIDYKQVIRRLNTAYNLLSDSLLSEKKKNRSEKMTAENLTKIIG